MKNLIHTILFCAPFLVSAQQIDSTTIRRVDSLIQIARALTWNRDFVKALEVNAEAEKLALEKLGRESAAYGSCCHNYGRVYHRQTNYPEAEKWCLEALNLREKILGKEHSEVALSMNLLANVYKSMNNYEKAEPLMLEALAMEGRVVGKDHYIYASYLIDAALLYQNLGNYDKEAGYYLEAKVIVEKLLGKEHPSYSWLITQIGRVYRDLGDYEQAEVFLIEARNTYEKVTGKEHLEYGLSLNTLADLYRTMGNYAQAEPLYAESIAIIEKVQGKENIYYRRVLGNSAILYVELGNFKKAEQIYLEALSIAKKVMGVEVMGYKRTLTNLAIFYWQMGNYEKAEPLFHESIDLTIKAVGKEHIDYATTLINLASMYAEKEDYKKSELLFLEALPIIKEALGAEHADYATSLHNLGSFYFDMSDYKKSEPILLEARLIREKVLGKEHYQTASTVANLAAVYNAMGNFEKAELFYLDGIKTFERVLGKEHREYTKNVSNLASVYIRQSRFAEAAALFLEANKINRKMIETTASYASENEMMAFLNTLEGNTAKLQSLTQVFPIPELQGENYNNALFFNGLVLGNNRLLSSAMVSADSLSLSIYEKWQGCHRRLAKRYARPIADRKKIAEVEAEAEGYEKMLMRNLPAFNETRRAYQWQDVLEKLKPGEAAIEFVHYNFFFPDITDSTMYAALLLRPGDEQPRFIPLFEEKQLSQILLSSKGDPSFAKIYASRSIKPLKQGSYVGLYELIWKPMDSLLSGVNTVYFAPSGLLHRINFDAIPSTEKQVLADRFQLVRLGSTRSLAVPPVAVSSENVSNEALLFGGIQYEMDSTAIFSANERLKNTGLATRGPVYEESEDPNLRGESWNYLKGTEAEVDALSPILFSAGFVPVVKKGFDATEEAFKNIGQNGRPSPRVLHLATHGFFFPDPKEERPNTGVYEQETGFKTSHNPLVRSGLLLAGANHAWSTGKPLKKTMENGILTAYEISHMNLSNTELVVLSACETGLGDIEGDEGVYGLQRAFKIAGARYLMMSLWQVPDQETSVFMTTFYKHCC